MAEEKPPKKITLYQGHFIDFHNNGGSISIDTNRHYDKNLVIQELKEIFNKKNPQGMLKDFGGYISEVEVTLEMTKDDV